MKKNLIIFYMLMLLAVPALAGEKQDPANSPAGGMPAGGRRVIQPSVLARVGTEPVTMGDLKVFVAFSREGRALLDLFEGQALDRQLQKLMRQSLSQVIMRKLLLVIAWKKKAALENEVFRLSQIQVELPDTPGGIRSFVLTDSGQELAKKLLLHAIRRVGGRAAFLRELRSFGVTMREARTRLIEDLLIELYITRVEKVDEYVSPEEMRTYYDEHPEEFAGSLVITARRIFISKEKHKGGEAEKRLEKALVRVKSGEDYAKVAAELSDGPTGAEGGLCTWDENSSNVPASVLGKAKELDAGNVSDVIETDEGYHIISVEKKERKGGVTFEEALARIKKKIIKKRREKKLREIQNQGYREIKITGREGGRQFRTKKE